MKFNSLPLQGYLHSVLDYNSDTGMFTWKIRSDVPKQWNTKFSGKTAGQLNDNGYIEICINCRRYKAHRLAWVYVYGDVLDGFTEIDHKNRMKNQNYIDNLRTATKSQNCGNSVGRSRSGLPKGVEKNKSRFIARIMKDGKRFCLGTYDTPQQAHSAYRKAALKYHGEFARAS